MNTIYVNGTKIQIEGNCSNVSIKNGTISVGGSVIKEGLSGIVEIKWEGDLASLETDASVNCDKVHGNVSAGGSVSCGDVGGSLNSGGSAKCKYAGGSVNAGGSVRIG